MSAEDAAAELKRASGGLAFDVELEDTAATPGTIPKRIEELMAESPREITKEELEERDRKVEERKKQQEQERLQKVQEHLSHVEKVLEEKEKRVSVSEEDPPAN